MWVVKRVGRRAPWDSFAGVFVVLFIIGCGTSPLPDAGNAAQFDPAAGDPTPAQFLVREAAKANGQFDAAQPATIAINQEIVIEGNLESRLDVDLYALGAVLAGDQIVIDVTGHDGLNATASLFDDDGNLLDVNDDRSFYYGNHDPLITRVMREATGRLYLGVAVSSMAAALSEDLPASASYTVRVSHTSGQAVPDRPRQVVWLDCGGGTDVQIGLREIEQMRPFDAGMISARFAGQTDDVIDWVLLHMRRDFASYDVTLLDSRYDVLPAGPYSKLYFGNTSESYLGIADMVDADNAFLDQDAIVYAENLALMEHLLPDIEAVGQTLANVGSHELGHLLGLEHSAGFSDLMATGFTVTRIIEEDLVFHRALLHGNVFPVGWQDGPAILLKNLGPGLDWTPAARVYVGDEHHQQEASPDEATLHGVPTWTCATCGHPVSGR